MEVREANAEYLAQLAPKVPKGYKQTEVGVIPDEWDVCTLVALGSFSKGQGIRKNEANSGEIPCIRYGEIYTHHSDIIRFYNSRISAAVAMTSKRLRKGDLLFAGSGETKEEIGKCVAFVDDGDVYAGSDIVVLSPNNGSSEFFGYLLNAPLAAKQKASKGQGDAVVHISSHALSTIAIPLPPLSEQRAIASALSDVDALLAKLDQLIAKKLDLKQAAMQQLLTGKTRLPGFKGEWEDKRIFEIALPISEKNSNGDLLPVLTCSKHLGFVDSLGYFKNQVFSKDTSGYKVIRRGQIGYPSNHIEEGSIGLQDLYDVAIVSPIYVVFSMTNRVNSYFLHRLLKLDSYRQQFAASTSSSVDRRGSLRWPAFSQIKVMLPSIEEQTAIATVLSDMDAEIAALTARRTKTRLLKQGMMQELLTGRIRLV